MLLSRCPSKNPARHGRVVVLLLSAELALADSKKVRQHKKTVVWFALFAWSVWSVWLVFLFDPEKPNRPDKPNQRHKPAAASASLVTVFGMWLGLFQCCGGWARMV